MISGNDRSQSSEQDFDDGNGPQSGANVTPVLYAIDVATPSDLETDDVGPPLCQDVEGSAEEVVAGGEKHRSKGLVTDEHLWLPPNLEAGCPWDSVNYSCAFDVVFMAFYSIYGQSNHTWRGMWRAESPEWNVPLGRLFDELLAVTITGDSAQPLSSFFSDCRDVFRDQITQSNPTLFPRGHHFSPVVNILQLMLGGTNAQPLTHQDLICQGCHAKKDHQFSVSYLGNSWYSTQLRNEADPSIMPLEVILARFIERFKTEPGPSHQECSSCQGTREVRSLHFSETSWTWFEVTEKDQPFYPSFEITYRCEATQPTHTLHAAIYIGNCHFTARMRRGPTSWWEYDSQVELGKPQPKTIATEEELRWFGNKRLAFLIYRQHDVN